MTPKPVRELKTSRATSSVIYDGVIDEKKEQEERTIGKMGEHTMKCPVCGGKGGNCSSCNGTGEKREIFAGYTEAYIEGFLRGKCDPHITTEGIAKEFNERISEEFEMMNEVLRKIILRNTKEMIHIIHKMDHFENAWLATKYFGKLIDLFENDRENARFDHLKNDIKEHVLDAEPDKLLQCPRCKNEVNFRVFIGGLCMTMEEGSNEIVDLNGEMRINKPDDIVFICPKCESIILESCIY